MRGPQSENVRAALRDVDSSARAALPLQIDVGPETRVRHDPVCRQRTTVIPFV